MIKYEVGRYRKRMTTMTLKKKKYHWFSIVLCVLWVALWVAMLSFAE